MPLLRLLSFAILAALTAASNHLTINVFQLRQLLSPGTGIFLASDSNYTSETIQRWDAFSEPQYTVSVKPALETDVQKLVSLLVYD